MVEISFREAEVQDSDDLFNWRNDSETRKNSFNSDPILIEKHNKWFEASLKNPLRDIFILFDKELKVGTIRFDRLSGEKVAEINITIAPEARGKGYGSEAIRTLSSYYLDRFSLDYIIAKIKSENKASSKSFIKAGYIFYKSYGNNEEYHFSKKT